jgi:hypothetical protein
MSFDNDQTGKLLSDPFESSDIEWRVQASGIKKDKQSGWVRVVPYITSRAVQQRLDDVFGVLGWENTYKEAKQSTIATKAWADGKLVTTEKMVNNWLCGITVYNGDKKITKWDGAEETAIEPFKGGLSGATKRAAVQFGIGRYLYHLNVEYATCKQVNSRFDVSEEGTYIEIKTKGSSSKIPFEWFPPSMPEWALPNVKADELLYDIKEATDIITLKSAYGRAYKYANSFNRGDLVKRVVEEKDIRKAQLTKLSDKEDDQTFNKIVAWLERAVLTEISTANNESVLKLAKKRLTKEISTNALEAGVDVFAVNAILEKRYQEQLNKLNAERNQ